MEISNNFYILYSNSEGDLEASVKWSSSTALAQPKTSHLFLHSVQYLLNPYVFMGPDSFLTSHWLNDGHFSRTSLNLHCCLDQSDNA